MQETIVNLSHENELLKLRLFGNKAEPLHTRENQLALGACSTTRNSRKSSSMRALARTKAHAASATRSESQACSKSSTKTRAVGQARRLGRVALAAVRSWRLLRVGQARRQIRCRARMATTGGRCAAAADIVPAGSPPFVGRRAYTGAEFGLGIPHYRLRCGRMRAPTLWSSRRMLRAP